MQLEMDIYSSLAIVNYNIDYVYARWHTHGQYCTVHTQSQVEAILIFKFLNIYYIHSHDSQAYLAPYFKLVQCAVPDLLNTTPLTNNGLTLTSISSA